MTIETQQPPRVALFIPSLICGGAERMTINLARAMTQMGLPVDVVVSTGHGVFVKDVPAEARFIDLGLKHIRSSIRPLVKYLKRENPYGMIARMSHTNVMSVIARTLAGTKTKLVLTEATHVSRLLTEGTRWRRWRQKYQVLPLARWAYPKADAVVCVSQGVADDLSEHLKTLHHPPAVISNPVVDDRMLELAQKPPRHRWLQKPVSERDVPVLVAVGSLRDAKDYPTLLRAVAALQKRQPVKLVAFGEGIERSNLEALRDKLGLQETVEFPGYNENPYAEIANASLFVLSSRREGSPNALTEALACGVPVVATDCPSGPAEILEEGKWGLLVPVGASEDLANAIEQTLEKPLKKQALQQRAARYSSKRAALLYLMQMDYPVEQFLAAELAELQDIERTEKTIETIHSPENQKQKKAA